MKLNDPSLLREQCFVGGAWIGVPQTEVTDPATGEVIARVPRFGTAEARDAIEKANVAFPKWARTTGKEMWESVLFLGEQGHIYQTIAAISIVFLVKAGIKRHERRLLLRR